jgi:hypothetical protein
MARQRALPVLNLEAAVCEALAVTMELADAAREAAQLLLRWTEDGILSPFNV